MAGSKTKILEEFVDHSLGFPVRISNATLQEMFGEWVLAVNSNNYQRAVLVKLAGDVDRRLTGKEIFFIRQFMEMTQSQFGALVGVSHVSVVKWEAAGFKPSRMEAPVEILLRIQMLKFLARGDQEIEAICNALLEHVAHLKKLKQKRPTPVTVAFGDAA